MWSLWLRVASPQLTHCPLHVQFLVPLEFLVGKVSHAQRGKGWSGREVRPHHPCPLEEVLAGRLDLGELSNEVYP